MFSCQFRFCNKTFRTKDALKEHEFNFHGKIPNAFRACCKLFSRKDKRHHTRGHHLTCSRYTHLLEKVSSIHVTLSDREKSFHTVEKVLKEIGKTFSHHHSIFAQKFKKTGSFSTGTKIFEADEFDFDVPLKYSLEEIHIRRRGDLYYQFTQKQQTLNLNVPMTVRATRDYKGIPSGYAEVKTTAGHEIWPRKIHEELYQDLKCAISKLQYIKLSRKPHGPALTITITQPDFHEINVDVVPSISTNQISLKDFNWPRPATEKVITEELIIAIHNAGLHLIPKSLQFWYISISTAGNALMNGLDMEDAGCRKCCHKLLKADFNEWKNSSTNGLPGMSTMVFKHQLFWMHEEYPELNWSKDCLHERYVDMLKDLSVRLRSGTIYNYFRDVENILNGKDQQVLNQVANKADEKRKELLKMC